MEKIKGSENEMGRKPKNNTQVTDEIKKEKKKLTCYCCGKEKKDIDFYMTKSFSYKTIGRLPVCKDCVGKIYEKYFVMHNDTKLAIYYMCRNLDICFSLSCYNAVISQTDNSKKTEPWKLYMQKLNSLGGKNGAGDDFDSSDDISSIDEKKRAMNENEEDNDMDSIIFWGEGYSNADYNYLNSEYSKMIERYECDSYAQETLFQDIAFQRLDIRKKRQMGQSVDKELKTLQDLLGSANIKPNQESASMANEQLTFGTLIKKYENEKPIPEALPEWMTADWIRKYVCVWFFGNLCRMMGKPNPYMDEYKEEIDKYTVKTCEDGEL